MALAHRLHQRALLNSMEWPRTRNSSNASRSFSDKDDWKRRTNTDAVAAPITVTVAVHTSLSLSLLTHVIHLLLLKRQGRPKEDRGPRTWKTSLPVLLVT